MPRTIIDAFGDEVSEADFDDFIPLSYTQQLKQFPDCQDPDHPMCPKCEPLEDPDIESDTI